MERSRDVKPHLTVPRAAHEVCGSPGSKTLASVKKAALNTIMADYDQVRMLGKRYGGHSENMERYLL